MDDKSVHFLLGRYLGNPNQNEREISERNLLYLMQT